MERRHAPYLGRARELKNAGGNISSKLTDAEDQGQSEQPLPERDKASYRRPPGADAHWRSSGTCYADMVLLWIRLLSVEPRCPRLAGGLHCILDGASARRWGRGCPRGGSGTGVTSRLREAAIHRSLAHRIERRHSEARVCISAVGSKVCDIGRHA
jgi:hypothetical protein